MNKYQIQKILISTLPLQEVYVSGDKNHFQIIAISKIFAGISIVKQQQIIYAPLMKYIEENHIHALSIETYTPKEWERLTN